MYTLQQTLQQIPVQKQCIQMKQQHVLLRTQLASTLRNEEYHAQAHCPACRYKLKVMEILHGFTDDSHDFTTECPRCARRFAPRLISRRSNGSQIELPLYCDVQAIELLREMSDYSPSDILNEEPAAYRSAIFHFGSLRKMFAQIDISYDYREIHHWREKVVPYLGKLPDTVIADCVQVSVYTIRNLRKKRGIPAYTKSRTLVGAT